MLTSAARRVKKEDVKPQQECDGLERCLDAWLKSMHRDDRDTGMRIMKLASDGDGWGDDESESLKHQATIAEATNAMINSLARHHWWAINKFCKISQVWNFPQLDFLETLKEAEENLTKKLKKNIATAYLFR